MIFKFQIGFTKYEYIFTLHHCEFKLEYHDTDTYLAIADLCRAIGLNENHAVRKFNGVFIRSNKGQMVKCITLEQVQEWLHKLNAYKCKNPDLVIIYRREFIPFIMSSRSDSL